MTKLPAFNPCPDYLIESEFKCNGISCLMEEIRWRNTQVAIWLLLTTLLRLTMRIQVTKTGMEESGWTRRAKTSGSQLPNAVTV